MMLGNPNLDIEGVP